MEIKKSKSKIKILEFELLINYYIIKNKRKI